MELSQLKSPKKLCPNLCEPGPNVAPLLGETLVGCLGPSEPTMPGDTQTFLPPGELGSLPPLFTVLGGCKNFRGPTRAGLFAIPLHGLLPCLLPPRCREAGSRPQD